MDIGPLMAAIAVVVVIAQLGGMFWLSPRLSRKQFGYRVNIWFVLRNWLLFAITGWWSDKQSHDETSPLGRRLRLKVDNDRTNAQEIASERQILARLMSLPHDTGGSVAAEIRASEQRLASLRAYDNNVAALIGLGVLSADVNRAQLSAASVDELLEQARG